MLREGSDRSPPGNFLLFLLEPKSKRTHELRDRESECSLSGPRSFSWGRQNDLACCGGAGGRLVCLWHFRRVWLSAARGRQLHEDVARGSRLHEDVAPGCCTRTTAARGCALPRAADPDLELRRQTCSSWLRVSYRGLQEQQVLSAGPGTQPRPRVKSLLKVKAFDKEQGISCKVLFSGVSLGRPFICQECSRAQAEGGRAYGRAEQVPGRTALDFRGPRLPWELAAPPRPTFLTHAFRRRARD